ncbi:ferritin family protein [Chloroflexota bacterium]
MATEQDKTLAALQAAIQMEIDGQEYYQRASEGSGNQLGRELFRSLAAEETLHRRKFEEIYGAIREKKAWPVTDFQPDGGKKLRTIFAAAIEETGTGFKAAATELGAVQIAMDMESRSYDLYQGWSQTAASGTEREFYRALAAEEREHHLVLLDYYEYLKDPAGWFTNQEHPSLDGG